MGNVKVLHLMVCNATGSEVNFFRQIPWMNTITSSDQFKPVRIGENLVVNYNAR